MKKFIHALVAFLAISSTSFADEPVIQKIYKESVSRMTLPQMQAELEKVYSTYISESSKDNPQFSKLDHLFWRIEYLDRILKKREEAEFLRSAKEFDRLAKEDEREFKRWSKEVDQIIAEKEKELRLLEQTVKRYIETTEQTAKIYRGIAESKDSLKRAMNRSKTGKIDSSAIATDAVKPAVADQNPKGASEAQKRVRTAGAL